MGKDYPLGTIRSSVVDGWFMVADDKNSIVERTQSNGAK